MKTIKIIVGPALLALLLTLNLQPSTASAQGTAFTYQGRLNSGGSPATGNYDLTFSLFSVSTGGSPVAGPLTQTGVGVTNGLFTVLLDYGSGVFNGTTYWLEIGVRTNGAATFATLAPRQQLTPTPYAIYGETAGLANSVANSTVSSSQLNTLAPPTSGQVLQFNGSALVWANPANTFSAWSLAGNAGTTAGPNFVGTTDNQPLEFHINGQRAFRLEPTITVPNVIGGFGGNVVDSGAQGATIGGGGVPGYTNQISSTLGTIAGGSGNVIGTNANDSTIAGGRANQISTGAWGGFIGGGFGIYINPNYQYSTVGGGYESILSGNYAVIGGGQYNFGDADYTTVSGGYENSAAGSYGTVGGGYQNGAAGGSATVGGGYQNVAGGVSATIAGGQGNNANNPFGTVSGGDNNTAGDYYATVGGGFENTAGYAATVPGGALNTASGSYSFAAGNNAQATDNNSFVWGDGSRAGLSQGANTFNILATGGFFIFSGTYPAGIKLAAGTSAWATLSDRNAKKNFQPVDYQAVLEKLARVPIAQWNYKWEKDTDVPNIGPMAQDFKAAFYPGRDDKSITTLEFDGVELAAIQGLNEKLEGRSQKAEGQIEELKAENAELKARLAKLEQVINQKNGDTQ